LEGIDLEMEVLVGVARFELTTPASRIRIIGSNKLFKLTNWEASTDKNAARSLTALDCLPQIPTARALVRTVNDRWGNAQYGWCPRPCGNRLGEAAATMPAEDKRGFIHHRGRSNFHDYLNCQEDPAT
jgi:hypothetical protein